MKRRLAAIMAADVVGYSRLMGQDEEGTLRRVKSLLLEEVRPRVAEHKGRVVKTMGDGFLASFNSVFEAFQCALKLQKAAEARNQGIEPDKQIIMRIGLNVGDIIIDGGDVFGDGVNIAARLESLARPGGICVSSRAWEDLRKLDLKFTDMGELKLKNIARPVRAYAFQHSDPYATATSKPTPTAAGEAASDTMGRLRRRLPLVAAIAGGALVLAGAAAILLQRPKPGALAVVRNEIEDMPCSWLRVSDQSEVDGVQVYKLSGSSISPPGEISGKLLQAARRSRVDVDHVITTDVAPLYPSQCAWIDKLKGFRYAGVARFGLDVKPTVKGVTRVALTLDSNGLGAAGAVYGIEPSGAVERIVDRSELVALGLPRNPDGSYTLDIDIDHLGWNGIVFMESKTPVPKGVIEQTIQSQADRQRFEALARAGGWRFELAWFKAGR